MLKVPMRSLMPYQKVIVLDGQVYGKESPDAATKRAVEVVALSREELAQNVEVG